jgi:hypothetical protein
MIPPPGLDGPRFIPVAGEREGMLKFYNQHYVMIDVNK